jgi:hypothetical protein
LLKLLTLNILLIMKYVITKEQRFFFEKNHYIEFEELISAKQLQILQKKIATLPLKRDISRHNAEVRKVLHSLRLARIAAELSHTYCLRFGFDRVIVPEELSFSILAEESSIQGLECCMMLCIDGMCQSASDEDSGDGIDPFPSLPGSGKFFLPGTKCSSKGSQHHRGQKFLLFTWAKKHAIYTLQLKDPYTHELKKEGLVFGDRLREKEHPVILRSRYD